MNRSKSSMILDTAWNNPNGVGPNGVLSPTVQTYTRNPDLSRPTANQHIRDISPADRYNGVKFHDSLSQRIYSSTAYVNAATVFSQDPNYGPRYMTLLEAIPTKYSTSSDTWLDDLTGSNKQAETDRLSYEAAITEIQNLLQSYYEFVNTLPTEQASQMSAIGHNLALSDSLSGSQAGFNEVSANQNASITSGNDILGSVVNGVSAISSIFSAATTVASSFQNIRTQEFSIENQKRQFIQNLSNYFRSNGYSQAANDIMMSDYDEGAISLVNTIMQDPTNLVKQNQQLIAYLSRIGIDKKIIDKFTAADEINITELLSLQFPQLVNKNGIIDVNAAVDSTMSYYLQDHIYRLKASAMNAKYTADYNAALNADDAAEAENLKHSYEQELHTYDIEYLKFKVSQLKQWIKDYKDTKDPIAKRCLMESIMNISSQSLFLEQVQEMSQDIFNGEFTFEQFCGSLLMILAGR